VEIAGCGMTSDAHHFVAPNLDTIEVCILKAIQEAGITPDIIDSVNAHATSTRSGDKVEFDALKTVLPTINYCHDPSMDLDCVSEGARPLAQEDVCLL